MIVDAHFIEGYRAAREGCPETDCPHDGAEDRAEARAEGQWRAGYAEAQRDARPRPQVLRWAVLPAGL